MPRDASGVYSLPPVINPVIPGTDIEAAWANETLEDVAAALTGSLPRNGSAPMTGPLILKPGDPVNAREAASKAFVEKFMAYASGLPVGAVGVFAGAVGPIGFLKCNGQEVSRVTYSALFAVIGVTFGAGDGVNTFNVPNIEDYFIKGRIGSRTIGSKVAGSIQSHTHGITDSGHSHGAEQVAHAHALNAHAHGVADFGHTHGITDPSHVHPGESVQVVNGLFNINDDPANVAAAGGNTGAAFTGISVNSAGTGVSVTATGDFGMSAAQPTVSVNMSVTGVSVDATGGTVTEPQNIAFDYYIKALPDGTGSPVMTGIDTSDWECISVDSTNPAVPTLVIHTNVPNGLLKLDSGGNVPVNSLPFSSSVLLGYYDASTNLNPSEAFPSADYDAGQYYIVSVAGTILAYDPITLLPAPTPVAVGDTITFVENSPTNPTGWYTAAVSSVAASNVSFIPTGSISAGDVQGAIAELDAETTAALVTKQDSATAVQKDTQTGAAHLPTGTAAQRPVAPQVGDTRANTTTGTLEWYNGAAWVSLIGNGPAFSAGQAAPTALPASTFVKLDFQTEEYDTNAAYDPITGRFQPQVAGYYTVCGGFEINTTQTSLALALYKNGVLYRYLSFIPSAASSAVFGSCQVFLNGTTDYVELWGRSAAAQATGGSASITYFQGSLVRPA